MDNNSNKDNNNCKNEWGEIDLEKSNESLDEKNTDENSKEMVANQATFLSSNKYTDEEPYPENTFSYFETNQVDVQLNTGTFHYKVTDFVLPGRNGFDLSISRKYDSGRANKKDLEINISSTAISTGSKINNFDTKMYGLGYGWSFTLPSIETVTYKSYWLANIDYHYESDYIVHFEDGRSINTKDYKLKDFEIKDVSGAIRHPYYDKEIKNYKRIITHKDGSKDYFTFTSRKLYSWFSEHSVKDYKLIAREDRLGNVMYINLNDYGGMTIIDTWGETINLKKENGLLTWILPQAEGSTPYNLSYKIEYGNDLTDPQRLTETVSLLDLKTTYTYLDSDVYYGYMKCASGTVKRPYILLSSIKYPNDAQTQFEYGTTLKIKQGSEGYINHFPLSIRKDIVNSVSYHLTEYDYTLSKNTDYIEQALVKKHNGDIQEIYLFSEKGLMTEKEVKDKNIILSKSKYTYDMDKKLILSATDNIYNRADINNFLTNETFWEYSNDNKANIIIFSEKFSDTPLSNQEITTKYDDYNMVICSTHKKGNDTIKESNDYITISDRRLLKSRKTYEINGTNEVLVNETVYDYTDNNNPFCVTNEKQYLLDTNNELEQSDNYIEVSYIYDSSKCTHNFVSKELKNVKDVDGNSYSALRETYDYDRWGRMISKIDARNQMSTFRYDKLGRIVEETLPLSPGQTVTNKTDYDDSSNYITKTDGKKQKTRIKYNPFGKVQKIFLAEVNELISADILLKDFQYDVWGNLFEINTYDGDGTSSNNVRKTEGFTFDTLGRVLSRSIPQVDYYEEYQYDDVFVDPEDGRKYYREKKNIWGDNSAPNVVTEIYKDQKGQIRKEFLAGSRTATYEYDSMGNMTTKIDSLDRVERYEYNYAGQIVKTIRTEAGQERITRTEYDALGNKRFIWDEDENRTEFQYDNAGRLIKTIAPFDTRNQEVKHYYDESGNVTCVKKAQNGGWQEIQNVYDAGSRLSETYQYLELNNWIRTSYQYDVMGNITQMRTGDTLSGNGRQVTTYTYDRFGNVLTTTDARGCKEYYQYDKTGRLQEKTDRNGNRIIYQHDALNRLIKENAIVKNADGTLRNERVYTYSKIGRKIKESSCETQEGKQPIFLETEFHYNNKGQLEWQKDPGNTVKVYQYDNSGNRVSFQLTHGGQTIPDTSLYYLYDDRYRLKQVRKNGAAGMVMAEYEYDTRGNRKTLRYPQSGIETSYEYNLANRVTDLKTKQQGVVISAWKYVYDVDGNLLAKTDTAVSPALTISYCYDRLGRLIEEHYPDWKRSYYNYDSYSNRIKMMTEGRTRDEPVSVTSYQYGLNNWLEKETKKQGKTTETYHYRYDNNGNETFRIWEKTAPTPDYPGVLRLSGTWSKEAPTVYEWRHYNGFNQLIKINQDDKEITYLYRPDGLRHSSSVRDFSEGQSKTNTLYWDGSNIVAEKNDNENIKRYLRGINLIAGEIDGMVYYYILNEHGDVAWLQKINGSRKAIYEYDAFGVEKSLYKEDVNSFRYCGEYLDLSSDAYYLRARDYRPSIGRFTAEDPIGAGLNWYSYCEGDPVNRVDPLGLDSYILYDPGMHKLFPIDMHMKQMALGLEQQYGTKVHTLETTKWTPGTFETWWNNLPSDVDAVVIATHGVPDRIQFDIRNDTDGRRGANLGLNTTEMSGLKVKDMDMLLLLGCNMGHLDHDNIGKAFASYIGNNGRVIAADGTVTWYPWNLLRNPSSGIFGPLSVFAPIKISDSDTYRSWLPSGSNRAPVGFVSYFNQGGETYSENIWRAADLTNMSGVLTTLWGLSRPFMNMNVWNEVNNA